MSNLIYPKYKESILQSDPNTSLMDNTVKVLMIDTDQYTYDAAHQFKSDVTGIVATSSIEIKNKSVTNGLFSGDQVLFVGATGNQSEALIVYIETGLDATSRLVAYIDTSTGLPITPNGADITVNWNNGIFQL